MKTEFELHVEISPYTTIEQLQAMQRAFPNTIEVRLVQKGREDTPTVVGQPLTSVNARAVELMTESAPPVASAGETGAERNARRRTAKAAKAEAAAPAEPTPIETAIAEQAPAPVVDAEVVSVTPAPAPAVDWKARGTALVTQLAQHPKIGVAGVVNIFKMFNVKRFSELRDEDLAAFCEKAEAQLATVGA